MPTQISYAPLPQQRADVHLPDDDATPVLVYLHGGGLEGGARGDVAGLAGLLVGAGIGVVSADYRLYPDARYPDFVEDAAAVVAWVLRELPGRPVLVGGSSAGAYLAMMLCFETRWLAEAGAGAADVSGWWFDGGQPTTHFNVLRERGVDPRRVVVDEAAPLFHVGEQAALAPTLLTLAADDIPGRREQTDLLLATLHDFGLAEGVRFEVLDGYQHSGYFGDEQGLARVAALVGSLTAQGRPIPG